MKPAHLDQLSVQDLLARFAQICIAQDEALLANEIARFNRLFGAMLEIVNELKRRPGDQRRELLQLYGHPNMQVRLKAAKNSLAVAPKAARRLIEEIKDSNWLPQSGEAGMTLQNLDDGIFKPT
jgi:ParB-like chromosome segregation protein Spo0J